MVEAKMLLNEELNGVELYFESKPGRDILDQLKGEKFRWNNKKKCWYNKQTDRALSLAKEIASGEIMEVVQVENKKVSLWDRVTTEHTKNLVGQFKFIKDVTRATREYVKENYPEIKISGRTNGRSVDIEIKSGIYEYVTFDDYLKEHENDESLKGLPIGNKQYILSNGWKEEENIILNRIIKDIDNFISQYHFQESDAYTDYFNNNFFYSVEMDIDYKQTEATEEQKQDIEDFYIRLEEFEKQEEEARDQAFKERQKRLELERLEREKEEERIKGLAKVFKENHDNISLEEPEQYFVKNVSAGISKPNNIEDALELLERYGDDRTEDVKIVREIYTSSEEAFEYIGQTLLGDLGILSGIGGSETPDNRVNSSLDYYYMEQDERDTVKFYNIGVAVYFKEKLQFIINPEGYDYARYIYIPTERTVKSDKMEYKQVIDGQELEELKEQARALVNLEQAKPEDWYDSILENGLKLNSDIIRQVENVDKIRILYDLLYTNRDIERQIKELKKNTGKYMTVIRCGVFKPEKYEIKPDRVLDNTMIHLIEGNEIFKLNRSDEFLIYPGKITLPSEWYTTVKKDGDFVATSYKFASFDRKMIIETYKRLNSQGIRPIYNTIHYREI